MKYKKVYIFFVLIFFSFFTASGKVKLNIANNNLFDLTVSFEKPISYNLYDSIVLVSNNHNFTPTGDFDTITKMYTLKWTNLPKNRYSLKLKTVFGDYQFYKFRLRKDTSFIVVNKYELTDLQNIDISNYKKSNCIKIYFRSQGCFDEYKEKFLIERNSANNYLCTLTRDSTAYKDTMGRKMFLEIPVHITKYVDSSIIDSIFKLITSSNYQQNIIEKTGGNCFSSTIKYLFVLSDKLLFQFNNYGSCDWDSYSTFVREYINDKKK